MSTPDANGWMPIESAPRNVMILLTDGRFVVPGGWMPALHGEKYPWAFVDEFLAMPHGCCDREDDTRVATNAWQDYAPTHWQHFPGLPVA